MQKIGIKKLFWFIILLAALGQVAADLYLPSLPHISSYFKTTTDDVQLSVAVFMFGFALSQLFYGFISDLIGRRAPLILGSSLCLIGTLVALFSNDIGIFNLGRFIQGIGAGAGMTLARAIMRDLLEGRELARYFSFLVMASISIMASAPLLGGYIQQYFSWHGNFIFIGCYILFIIGYLIFWLPETKQISIDSDRLNFTFTLFFRNMGIVLRNKTFFTHALSVFFAYAIVLIWLTEGPIILQDGLSMDAASFGWSAFSIGLIYGVGAYINSRLVKFKQPSFMLLLGMQMVILGGFLLIVFSLLGIFSIAIFLGCVAVFMLGVSWIFPNAFAGAMHPFSELAGMSAALCGFIQILGGAIASLFFSIFSWSTPLHVGLGISLIGFFAVINFLIYLKSERGAL